MISYFIDISKVKGKNTRRGGPSSSGWRKLAEMVRTWHKTANRSTHEQLRSEKLEHRRLTALYGGQPVMVRRCHWIQFTICYYLYCVTLMLHLFLFTWI